MNIKEYMKLAPITESIVEQVTCNKYEFLHALNAFITAGKLLDALKRKIFYSNSDRYDEDFKKLAEQLEFISNCLKRHHDGSVEEELNINSRILHAGLGIGSEASEVIEAIEKGITTGTFDYINGAEEILGDLCWYQAIYADAANQSWEEFLDRNIKKLEKRFKGKFDAYRANNRNLDEERKALEGK